MSAARFARSEDGTALTEFLLVVPLLITLVFAAIDVGLYMWQWNHAAKATQLGARIAVVTPPVAGGVNAEVWAPLQIGQDCSDPNTGALNGNPTWCPVRSAVCTSSGCTGTGFTPDFNQAAFDQIFDRMQGALPLLQRENVEIRYATTGLGFVGRPGGQPLVITVRLTCAGMPLIFLDFFLRAAWPAGCGASTLAPFPPLVTAITSEALGEV